MIINTLYMQICGFRGYHILPHVTTNCLCINVILTQVTLIFVKTAKMEAIIAQTDDYKTMAKTIYQYAAVGQSFKVLGELIYDTPEGKRIKEKGEAVIEYIDWLDKSENIGANGKRKRVKLPESVGGFVAQKIFRWKRVISNDEIKYTIWRFQ